MAKLKLSNEQVQYATIQYLRGRGGPSIALELGVDPVTLLTALRRHGVTIRPPIPKPITTPEMLDLAENMRAQGLPWKRIEARIGVSTNTLLLHLRRRKRHGRDS